MMKVLQDLHQQPILDQKQQWVIVEGDAKVYDILQSLKFEYGVELKWMIPYPGDWHLLKNYQAALMKSYYDAGLSALEKAAGYPLASDKSCTQFIDKRTHNFLLEAWEAIYRVMLTKFLAYLAPHEKESHDSITELITQAILPIQSQSHEDFLKVFNEPLAAMKNLVQQMFSKIPINHKPQLTTPGSSGQNLCLKIIWLTLVYSLQ